MSVIGRLAERFAYFVGKQIEDKRWGDTYQQYRRTYEISPTFAFDGPGILLYGDGRIMLLGGSYIGGYSRIQSWSNREVRIGKNCAIGHCVTIFTMNRLPDQDFSKTCNWQFGTMRTVEGNVKIGDDCWIGAYVYINQGVSIGDNAVVGTHSVVTRDIPPHSISAGAPAKVIRFKSYLEEKGMLELAERYWSSLSLTLKQQLQRHKKLQDRARFVY